MGNENNENHKPEGVHNHHGNVVKERRGNIKNCDETSSKYSGNKCKVLCIVSVITVVLICAAAEHFYNTSRCEELIEYNRAEMMKTVASIRENHDKQIESFLIKFNELNAQMDGIRKKFAELANKDQSIVCECCRRSAIREKWKVWVALRSKLEAEEQVTEELKVFNEVFAGDDELIQLVAELVGGVDVISSKKEGEKGKEEKLLDTCKQYLSRVVRIKKVDHRELSKISGYVLSSIEDKER
jgi:hypothetical protein